MAEIPDDNLVLDRLIGVVPVPRVRGGLLHPKTQLAVLDLIVLLIHFSVRIEIRVGVGAERMLLDVIERAESFERPLLAAHAQRNLAEVLTGQGRRDEAKGIVHRARARFVDLGALGHVRSLDAWIAECWETKIPEPGASR